MKYLKIVALLFLLANFAIAQKPATPLQTMVATEQSFAKTAEEKNTRDAFLEFIADDGLLFRPGAVNGKQWMLAHPTPPSDKHPLLAWQPAFALMSLAGDLGFTTGPWEFKGDRSDAKPSGYGHFVTVWKKQADGSWKFAVDLGIGHPQSGGPLKIWHVSDKATNATFEAVDVEIVKKDLNERDRALSDAVNKQGLVKAYDEYSDSEVRLYRNDYLPYLGKTESLKRLETVKGKMVSQPNVSDGSRSGDLGYTVGTYEIIAPDQKATERGNYLRIWRKKDGAWKIVLDVANPLPQ